MRSRRHATRAVSRWLCYALACGGALAIEASSSVAAARHRDAGAPVGTPSISGTVRKASDATPIGRARITATSPAIPQPRVAISGPDGRYELAHLPPGTYTVSATRTGFAGQTFGGRRAASPAAVAVADGQLIQSIDFALVGGGVIAGRVLDEDGSPFAGAPVDALATRFAGGQQTLESAASAQTDDLGEFRLFGLPPGEYYVSAADPAFASVGDETGAIHYAPTYYPGVALPDAAKRVPVGGTGEPPRIEFRLKLVPPARVSGSMAAYDDRQLLSGAVTMSPLRGSGAPVSTPEDVKLTPGGQFIFGHVPPGRYQIRARGQTAPGGVALFATYSLVVEGHEIDNLQLTLRPGAVVEGTVDVEARRGTKRPPLTTIRVGAPFTDGTTFGDPLTGNVHADGGFTLLGVMTGKHQIVVGGLPSPWIVKNVFHRGTDITDTAINLNEGEHLRDLRIVLTDVGSDVGGSVRDERGQPTAGALVLIFPATPQFWFQTSRRLRATRTDGAGQFQIYGLPTGEYRVVASLALDEQDAWRPEVLQALSAAATPLVIESGDARMTLDLRLLPAPRVPISR